MARAAATGSTALPGRAFSTATGRALRLFVDDGLKPVSTTCTKLGREITTTASHPFLAIDGWQPLVELAPGQRIAVPRALPYFGTKELPEAQVKILAYLIADGCLTNTVPQFTNRNCAFPRGFRTGGRPVPRDHYTHAGFGRYPNAHRVHGRRTGVYHKRAREFATNLRTAVRSYPHTARELAQRLEVSPALVSIWQDGTCVPNGGTFDRLCAELQVAPETLAPYRLNAISKNGKNPVTVWLMSWTYGAATRIRSSCRRWCSS